MGVIMVKEGHGSTRDEGKVRHEMGAKRGVTLWRRDESNQGKSSEEYEPLRSISLSGTRMARPVV